MVSHCRSVQTLAEKEVQTYAVGTRVLAVALGPELVALVAGAADPPPNGPSTAGDPRSRPVGMLSVLDLGSGAGQVRVVHAHMLLELL